jgi:extradiol dioxygenase
MKVRRLGYVVFSATDVAAWVPFATEILGMEAVPDGETLFLRMDDHHHRLVVAPAERDGLSVLGWEVKHREELADAAKDLDRAGVPYEVAGDDECARRWVRGLIRTKDPLGHSLEIFHGLAHHDGIFRPGRAHYGFVTGDQGLGHVVLHVGAADFAREYAFYREILGMGIASYGRSPGGSFAGFFRCSPRHHSFAVVSGDHHGFHHLMIENAHLDDVGVAYDLVRDRGVPLISELGRHSADNMVSFYVETPSGVHLEYGWGGRRIDTEDAEEDHLWFEGRGIWGHRWVGNFLPRTTEHLNGDDAAAARETTGAARSG